MRLSGQALCGRYVRGSVVLRVDLPFADILRERDAAPPGPDGRLNAALETLERRMLQDTLALEGGKAFQSV